MGDGLFLRNPNRRKTVRLSLTGGLFAAETQPDQVDGSADSDEQADQGENSLI